MIRKLLLATALAASAATTAFAPSVSLAQTATPVPAAPAAAAAPRPAAPPVLSPVVVYDLGRLIQESAAGQDMRTKLQAIATQINRELEPDQRQLQSELTAIRGTSVADAQTPAAQQRQEAFQRLYAQFQQKQERLAAVMQLTERNALESFNTAFAPALRETMVARNGLVALQAGQVEAFVPGVDITGDLLTRLNASTRTITVTRATLPAAEGAAAPAAAGAAPRPAAAPAAAGAPRPTPVPATGTLPRAPASPAPRN